MELTVQRTGPKFALCVLRPGVTDHAQIDLLIGTGNETVKFSVTGGSAKVHITGYEVLEETYDGFGDDDDSDDDEDDDEFGEVPGGDDDDSDDDDESSGALPRCAARRLRSPLAMPRSCARAIGHGARLRTRACCHVRRRGVGVVRR